MKKIVIFFTGILASHISFADVREDLTNETMEIINEIFEGEIQPANIELAREELIKGLQSLQTQETADIDNLISTLEKKLKKLDLIDKKNEFLRNQAGDRNLLKIAQGKDRTTLLKRIKNRAKFIKEKEQELSELADIVIGENETRESIQAELTAAHQKK